MRRFDSDTKTYRTGLAVEADPRWSAFEPESPPFTPIIERPTKARHCFSVCLYSEPLFTVQFPQRNFNKRYLENIPAVTERLAATNYALNIFCDAASLQTALNLNVGSVYLVTKAKEFAFQQHIWRYFSTLLPKHETIQCYHFRGMDNLLASEDELTLFERFRLSGCDIKHAPYHRASGNIYVPVRGSCSVAHEGIKSLGWWLQNHKQRHPTNWPETWHSDEDHLTGWFSEAKLSHRLFTIIDRELPMAFYRSLSEQIERGIPLTITRL